MNQLESWYMRVPIIKSDRLILRPMFRKDVAQLINLYSDPEIFRYLGRDRTFYERNPYFYFDRTVYNPWMMNMLRWVIVRREDQLLIGEMLLYEISYEVAKIGCRIMRSYQKNGYATEATNSLCSYIFEQQVIGRLQADVMVGNQASVKVLQKSGFKKIERQNAYGVQYDTYMLDSKTIKEV